MTESSNKPARIAVVILNWNGRRFLEQFLPSVCSGSGALATIWVADNASTDDSVDFVTENFPQVRLLRIPRNLGFAGGYNYALDRMDAEYAVLLNQDVAVEPGWLDPLLAALDKDPQIGAAQPKIRSEKNPTQFEYAGAAGGMLDALGYPFCRGRLFDHLEEDRGQYQTQTEIFWASGAALFIRLPLYRGLGGLDEAFFAHMEEIDLCWRVRRAGYKVVYVPDAAVFHVGGGSLERDNPRKLYLNFRNNGRMLVKNAAVGRLLWLLPLRLVLDTLAACRELLIGKPEMAKAAWKGGWNTIRHLPLWLRNARLARQAVQACSIGPDRSQQQGWYRGSLVWQVFVLGRKTWMELPNRGQAR
ncbi:MAG: glycosyltransferase [Bacteroidetes bacterium]|nr:glycosyltransferase [Bacteroidota bacterium]